jgi:triosephosphate isomerase
MTKKIIIANWKMHPTKQLEAKKILIEVISVLKLPRGSEKEIVFCPPFLWLEALVAEVKNKKGVAFGAQNCHWEQSGAYTGEISASMLAHSGVKYVILGHSERRQYLGETNEIVNLKIKAALKAGLKPILCVGEKDGEEMNLAVEQQLVGGLAGLSMKQMNETAVVYEPVWAISTQAGRSCLPDDALSTHLFIRRLLTKLYSRFVAEKIPVLYGGSVDAQNASSYIKIAHMNGLLVGGASLEAEEFLKIISSF